MHKPPVDPDEPARMAVPRYFAAYERKLDLPIQRPVHVTAVRRADADPRGRLAVDSDRGDVADESAHQRDRHLDHAQPAVLPGQETFLGRQLHVVDYVSARELTGQHVIVVGSGISAVQLLDERLSQVTATSWFTRREPVWRHGRFSPETATTAIWMDRLGPVEVFTD